MKQTLSAVYLFLYLGILLFSALNQTANEYPGWLTALDFSCRAGAVVCMMLYVIRLRPIFLSPLWKLVPIVLVMCDGFSWYYDFIVFADPEYKIPEILIATCLGIIILFPSWYLCFRFGYLKKIDGASEMSADLKTSL